MAQLACLYFSPYLHGPVIMKAVLGTSTSMSFGYLPSYKVLSAFQKWLQGRGRCSSCPHQPTAAPSEGETDAFHARW